jgi:mono/diheme cytochrome c family protein
MRRRARRAAETTVAVALLLAACDRGADTPEERGRQVYLANCIACHASDPAQPGAIGPPVKGASRELLDAKVLRGTYPPGYAPKRPTAIMQPMPDLAPHIGDLAASLR